jgi:6-pyruvoyltetrahydropterin/6-carboxytetrahydropterin synthase
MSASFHVRVAKEQLTFSAAHFITLQDGALCERLHGHNYRVAAEVSGPLDNSQCVVDFIALRDALADLITALDHHVLLPTESPHVRVTSNEQIVEAAFQDRRWAFPRCDCVLLPVENTTAEKLAEYLGRQLLEELAHRYGVRPGRLRVEIDECLGQVGICELTP